MRGDSHGGDLTTDDEGSTTEGDEDLGHDNVADIVVWLAEVDHEATSKGDNWQTKVKRKPLETTGVLDGDGDNDTPEAGSDRVDIKYVSGISNVNSVDNLQVGEEVSIPEVEGHKQDGIEEAGTNYGLVFHKLPWNEGLLAEPLLINDEEGDREDTKDEETQNCGTSPCVLLVASERKGKKEDGKTDGQEEDTNN